MCWGVNNILKQASLRQARNMVKNLTTIKAESHQKVMMKMKEVDDFGEAGGRGAVRVSSMNLA